VKWHSDERRRNSEIRGGKYWHGEKLKCRGNRNMRGNTRGVTERNTEKDKRERMYKESKGEMYLPALCRPSLWPSAPPHQGLCID